MLSPTTRRRFLVLAGATAVGLPLRRAAAADREFGAGSATVAALLTGLVDAQVAVLPALAPGEIHIGGTTTNVARGLLQKGDGAARARFLDDARNASKVAARARDALIAAKPDDEAAVRERHHAFARAFAKRVLRWELRLRKNPLQGNTVRDLHGRVYLLEWAGARISAKAKNAGPPALAGLPAAPTSISVDGYVAYVEALVSAVT